MGTLYTYECNKCGHSVQTSAGHDMGMLAVTDSYICTSCKEIVDVTVGAYGETFLNEELSLKELSKKHDLDFYACPKCGSRKDLEKWESKVKPCPKCDGKMRKDKDGGEIMWD